jgi:ligand-binding SRPBCC domain-containing protein
MEPMSTYRRGTRVGAPLEEVWEFHSRISGLEALTPGFMNLRVEGVVGPDGGPDPEVLEAGSRIDMSMRPLGVGPRRTWTSVITEREAGAGSAMFRDRMEDGPFPEWVHTHRFFADDGETLVVDHVEYRLPGGPLGEAVGPLGRVGFEPMFRYRHRRTRELLEDGGRVTA